MIDYDSDLFYDIYNTITEHKQRYSSLIIISVLSISGCITRSWSIPIEKIKSFAIVN